MGIAALVLGIISVIVGFIPFCGIIALVPAIVGLVLGIIDIVKKSKAEAKKGMSIAGVVCSGVSIVIILFWYIFAGALVVTNINEIVNELEANNYTFETNFNID